jgi:hypothetical protein
MVFVRGALLDLILFIKPFNFSLLSLVSLVFAFLRSLFGSEMKKDVDKNSNCWFTLFSGGWLSILLLSIS